MEMEITKRYVKYVFSDREKERISQDMAHAVIEQRAAEDGLKSVQADFKSKIALAQETVNSCANKISSGFEMRQQDCEVQRNFTENIVNVYRMDTGELIESRAMTMEERQGRLAIGKEAHNG